VTQNPETKLYQACRKAILTQYPTDKIVKIHGGPYQEAGLPDLLILHGPFAVWAELKMPGKKPHILQWAQIQSIRRAGGIAFVAYSPEQILAVLARLPWAQHNLDWREIDGYRTDNS
jgi:hypothetical protein